MNGFAGRILRVDLGKGITTIDSSKYLPTYVGGAAMAYRILWEETSANTNEWSPENPIIFATGPLAGTPVASSGRAQVIGLAPQSYPICWACTSGFGGDFGPKMKFAGWDAIVITGKSSDPVYLLVDETGGQLIDGGDVWGTTNYQAQQMLKIKHGLDAAIATIGPAGENRVRWAAIESNTENGAGQGGFGAVMGDKKIKAVVIKPGNRKVGVANPEKLIQDVNLVAREMSPTTQDAASLFRDRGRYTTRRQSCPFAACTGGISGCLPTMYSHVPQKLTGEGTISGVEYCCPGEPSNIMESHSSEIRSEIRRLEGNLGLNHWETQLGMNFFVQNCSKANKLNRLMGKEIPKDTNGTIRLSPQAVIDWWRAVAYRQGEGDIWADGSSRAADRLGLQSEIWKTHKHGYGPHWDGRYLQFVRSPVWIISALTWATHGRDAFDHEHDIPERYTSFIQEWGRAGQTSGWGTPRVPYAEICDLGRQLYGPYFPQGKYFNDGWDNSAVQYTDKEYVTIFHEYRGMMKDSIPMCDRQFPLLYDTLSKPAKVGDIEAETRMFNWVVGTDWTLSQMHQAAERAINVLRAIWLRQGRERSHDESVIPYFQQPDDWPNDVGPQTLDPVKFKALLERYYAVHGWDKEGRPTRATLESLGLKDVADELANLGKLGT